MTTFGCTRDQRLRVRSFKIHLIQSTLLTETKQIHLFYVENQCPKTIAHCIFIYVHKAERLDEEDRSYLRAGYQTQEVGGMQTRPVI
jgi:hypothetical protein